MLEKLVKLKQRMKEEEIASLLVTTPYNLRYITGFTGSTGLALITEGENFFVTDSRYTEQAAIEAGDFMIIQNTGPILDEIVKIVVREQIENIGFEEEISYAWFHKLEEELPMTCDIFSAPNLIGELRQIKTPEEIAKIQKACEITDKAFEYILGKIKPGVKEVELANELDFYMRKLGATGMSFDAIVASGYRSAMPHGVASNKEVAMNELITFDFGCYYAGYVSDMTRTVALGTVDAQLKEIYDIVLEANKRVIEKTTAGLSVADYDKLARDFIVEKGYGKQFGHGLGHGIGLEVHEGPMISQKLDDVLKVGQIVTDEPGIYLSGLGGVRIEDDLLITQTGNIILNSSSKEFIQL